MYRGKNPVFSNFPKKPNGFWVSFFAFLTKNENPPRNKKCYFGCNNFFFTVRKPLFSKNPKKPDSSPQTGVKNIFEKIL